MSHNNENMLTISKLKKRFGNNEVLKDIKLGVKQGEVIAIIGPSGSGKSTLLRCINYLEEPDDGIIQLEEIKLNAKTASKKQINTLVKKSSMVFQHYNLFKNKTVLENVTEGLIITKKMKKTAAVETGRKILERVGLTAQLEQYPATLSGGQQQRVGIARALAMETPLMLFDEPTSALDPELVKGVLDIIKSITELKQTMIIVTHEMSFAKEVADQIIFMEHGYIVETGPPEQVFDNPKNKRTAQFINQFNESEIEDV